MRFYIRVAPLLAALGMGACSNGVSSPDAGGSAGRSAAGGSGEDAASTGGSSAGGSGGSGGNAGGNGAVPDSVTECQAVGRRWKVSTALGTSTTPAIRYDGSPYVVVWADSRDSSGDIYASLLNADGSAQASKQQYAVVDAAAALTHPQVIETSSGYLVVYENCGGSDCAASMAHSIEAQALDVDGMPTGSVQLVSPAAAVERRMYLASAFGKTFVAYRDVDGEKVVIRLHALSDSGAVDAMPNGVSVEATQDALYPGLAVNSAHMALSYVEGDPSSSVQLHLYDSALRLVENVTVRALGARATNTAVAWTGSAWIVAWEDYVGATEAIHVAAVSADGSSVSKPVDVSQGNGNWPSLVSNGVDGLLGYYGVDAGGRVMLARIDSSGALLERNVVVSNAQTQDARMESVAYNVKRDEIAFVYADKVSAEVFFARAKCPLEGGAGGAAGAAGAAN